MEKENLMITFVMLFFISLGILSLFLIRHKVVGPVAGLSWFLFWVLAGIFTKFSYPLKKIMSLVSFVSYTNFLFMLSTIFIFVMIFMLYIGQKKILKRMERLAHELALNQFRNEFKNKKS